MHSETRKPWNRFAKIFPWPKPSHPDIAFETERVTGGVCCLPFDVLEEVIEYLDHASLKSYNIANRDFHAQSSKRLWRSVQVGTSWSPGGSGCLYTEMAQLSTIICRGSQRASYIERLQFSFIEPGRTQVPYSVSQRLKYAFTGQPDPVPPIENSLFGILTHVPNLKHLNISSLGLNPVDGISEHVCALLCAQCRSFPFQLESWSTNLPFSQVWPFLETQRGIISCVLRDSESPRKEAPPTVFPHLEHYYGSLEDLLLVAPGRPIRSVTLTPGMYIPAPSTNILIRSLNLSTRPLVALSLHNYLPESLIPAISQLIPHLTSLEYLECAFNSSGEEDFECNPTDLAVVLEALPLLQEVSWVDHDWFTIPHEWRDQFVRASRHHCPSLRRIRFRQFQRVVGWSVFNGVTSTIFESSRNHGHEAWREI